ncbi:MAG: GNAT family N-acetyltransferase [Pelomonas sp.]|nr:GNAT family N-acetyltransferase [Roseateles sp.]
MNELLSEAADYNLQTYGGLPGSDAAEWMFHGFPQECRTEDRLIMALFDRHEAIGLAQVARAYPTPEIAHLGLLLIRPARRRHHLGCEAFEQLSHKARTWPGIERWQLGVLETNEAGLRFWRHCGFRTVASDRREHGIAASGCVMERAVKARPACRGGRTESSSRHTHAGNLFAVLR